MKINVRSLTFFCIFAFLLGDVASTSFFYLIVSKKNLMAPRVFLIGPPLLAHT